MAYIEVIKCGKTVKWQRVDDAKTAYFPRTRLVKFRVPAAVAAVVLALLIGGTGAQAGSPMGAFSLVDAGGKAVAADAIPADLRQAVLKLVADPKLKTDLSPDACALVVARTLLPADEKDLTFSSTLRGKSWEGGMHYIAPGGVLPEGIEPLDNAVCIRLADFSDGCALEVAKMGYKTVTLDVPKNIRGKIIWMGDIKLQRYQGKRGIVKGTLTLPGGGPLDTPGEVSIRINGTTGKISVPLAKGSFAFRDIAPGQYLVEFWIKDYSVATWWVTATEAGAETNVIAYKLATLDIDLHSGGQVTRQSVKCGVAYADARLDISPTEKLRLNQSGRVFDFYTPAHKIVVLHGPFTDMKAVAARAAKVTNPSFSWSGQIVEGDLIVLVADKRAGDSYVYAVAEIVKVHDAGAATAPATAPATQESQPATASQPSGGDISGSVTRERDGSAAANAKVQLFNAKRQAIANASMLNLQAWLAARCHTSLDEALINERNRI